MADEDQPRERKPLDAIQRRYLETLASMASRSRPNLAGAQIRYLNWLAMDFVHIDEFCEEVIKKYGGTPEDLALLYRDFNDVSLDDVPDDISGRTKPPGKLQYNPVGRVTGQLQEEIDAEMDGFSNIHKEKIEQYVLFCRPYLLHFLWGKIKEVN